MSDVPVSKRAKSKNEAFHLANNLRKRCAAELLHSFGYSQKKLEAAVQKHVRCIQDPVHREEMAETIRSVNDDYNAWFIKRHRDRVDDLCCQICEHIKAGITIWPNFRVEFYDRRNELNQALKYCNRLQVELQYIAECLPADKNKYTAIVLDAQRVFTVIKALRQSDNRFLGTIADATPEERALVAKRKNDAQKSGNRRKG